MAVAMRIGWRRYVNAHEEEKIGDTVLKLVAPNCSLELARILLAAGADPTIRGWMWLTALDKSSDRKRSEGVEVHRLMIEAARRLNPNWPRLTEFTDPRAHQTKPGKTKPSKGKSNKTKFVRPRNRPR
jgi:hypothetical protein